MIVTVRLLGVEVLHLELTESPDPEPDRGELGSMAAGFTARMDVPPDLVVPSRET